MVHFNLNILKRRHNSLSNNYVTGNNGTNRPNDNNNHHATKMI